MLYSYCKWYALYVCAPLWPQPLGQWYHQCQANNEQKTGVHHNTVVSHIGREICCNKFINRYHMHSHLGDWPRGGVHDKTRELIECLVSKKQDFLLNGTTDNHSVSKLEHWSLFLKKNSIIQKMSSWTACSISNLLQVCHPATGAANTGIEAGCMLGEWNKSLFSLMWID